MRSKRLVTTGGHYAFLKISEGCNKRCTYCIIPSLRGPYRSVPMEQLLAEAKELADHGTVVAAPGAYFQHRNCLQGSKSCTHRNLKK